MATAAVLSPHDVQTTLNYFSSTLTEEAPYNYTYTPPEGVPQTNVVPKGYASVVHDLRGKEDTVSLDTTGFAFVKHASQEKEFVDEEAIKTAYYKEVEDLLKQQTGAKRIFIFDHTIRRVRRPPQEGQSDATRSPVTRVHVDQSFKAGYMRVHHHMGDDAERLLKGRVRIINVWRPIGNPVAHHPLAVADWRTLNPDEDLISTRHLYRDREGYTFSVKYNPKHQWYYLGGQTPEEVILIKCFDSDETRARLTPHTAFLDSTSPAEAPQRQSIEVRCLVFDEE
ncbi:methyltransferase [Artomyces pyxidatus]|uniref:Methyltransferase n=1 Tax=Artomyces pyxidatus TaxID=48021 RepID=A0ACB8SNL3_9AGAM|nr:methyltransferase [Artomyces pyxidatus]